MTRHIHAGTPAGGGPRAAVRLPAVGFLIAVFGAVSAFAGGTKESTGTDTSGAGSSANSSESAANPVTLQWWDWSDSIADYTRATFAKYEQEHPGIKVKYSLYTVSQFKSNILLAIRGGTAPDIFPIPTGFTFLQALKEKWIQPIDKYVDELYPGGMSAWKARFPATSFVPGINVWDGKVYIPPKNYPGGDTALLYYNKSLFKDAGLDPNNPPKTWGELRADAKKITAAGNGKYYGIIMGGKQLNRWSADIGTLATTAGPVAMSDAWTTGINLKTGKYDFEDPAFAGALTLFTDMNSDGSFYPGFISINAPEARELFGEGKAGFMFQGQWCVGVWRKNNPNLDFGVEFPPVPDSGRKGYVQSGVVAGTGDPYSLSATSAHPKEAAALFMWRLSDDWMKGYVQTGDGYAPFPKLDTAENIKEPLMLQIFKESQTDKRIAPQPIIKNPEGVGQAELQFKEVHPDLDEILQGAFTGGLDYVTAAKTLSAKMNDQLVQVVSDEKAKGTNVSLSDWQFPNWDPMKDYTLSDYPNSK